MDRSTPSQNPLTTPSQTNIPLPTTAQAPSITLSTSDQEPDGEYERYWASSFMQEAIQAPTSLELPLPYISNAKIDVKRQLIELIQTVSGISRDAADDIGNHLFDAYHKVCDRDRTHEILAATQEVVCSEAASKLRRVEKLHNYISFGCLYAECAVLNFQDFALIAPGSARSAFWINAYKKGIRIIIELALQAQEAWGEDIGMLKVCFQRWLGELPKASEHPNVCLQCIPAIQGWINGLAPCFFQHRQVLAEISRFKASSRGQIHKALANILPSLASIHDAENIDILLNKMIKHINAFFSHAEELARLELAPRPIALRITSGICWITRKRGEFPIHLTKLLSDVVQPYQDKLAHFVARCNEERFGYLLNEVLGIYGLDPSRSNPDAMREVLVQLLSIDQTGYFLPNDVIELFGCIFNYSRCKKLKRELKINPQFDFCSSIQHMLRLFIKSCKNVIEKYKVEIKPYLIVPTDLGSQIIKFVRESGIHGYDINRHYLADLELRLSEDIETIKKVCVQFECFLLEADGINRWIQSCVRSEKIDSSEKEEIIQKTLINYQRRNRIFNEWAEKLVLEPEELHVLRIKWDSSIPWMTSYFERSRNVSRTDPKLCTALLNFVYLLNHHFECSLNEVEEHLLRLACPLIYRLPRPGVYDDSIEFWLRCIQMRNQNKNSSNDAENPTTQSGRENIECFSRVVDFLSQEKGEVSQLLKVAFRVCPSQIGWILNVTAFETMKSDVSVEQEFAAWEIEVRARINCIIRIYNITEGSFVECIDLARKVRDEIEKARKAISRMNTTAEVTTNPVVENLEAVLTDREMELPRSVAALQFLLIETRYCTLPAKDWRLAIKQYVNFVKNIEPGKFLIDAAYSKSIEAYLRHVFTLMPLDSIREFGDEEIETCVDRFLNANASFKKQYRYGRLLNLKIKEAASKKDPAETIRYERLYQMPYLFDERMMQVLVPLLESEDRQDQEKANQLLERMVAIHAADPDQRSLMLAVDFLLHFLNHFEEVQGCLSQIGCEAIRAFEGCVQPARGQVRALATLVFFFLVEKHLKFTDTQKRRFIVEGICKTARLKGMKSLEKSS